MAYLPPMNGGRLNASISGNTSGTAAYLSSGNLILAGGSNVTLNQSLNTISFNAGAAGTNTFGASLGNASGNVGTINGTNVQLIFAGGNNITLSQSITNSSATISISGPSFSNSNNVSFGTLASAGNAYVTASVAAGGGSVAFSAGGSSANLASLTFANSNGMNFGLSNGIMTASGMTDGIQSVSAGTANISGGGLSFANSNGANFGLNGSTVTMSYTQQIPFDGGMLAAVGGGSTSGIAGTNSVGFAVAAGSNITLSQTTDLNGASVTINAAGGTISNWEPIMLQHGNISYSTGKYGNGNLYFHKLQPMAYVRASQMQQLISLSASTSASGSHTFNYSVAAGIFTANGSTLNLVTQSSASTLVTIGLSSNAALSLITGLKGITMPLSINMSPGNYWIGMWSYSASTSNGTAQSLTLSNVYINNNNVALAFAGLMNQAGNATAGIQEAVGLYGGSSTAMPVSAPMNSINQNAAANYQVPYIAFKNLTW